MPLRLAPHPAGLVALLALGVVSLVAGCKKESAPDAAPQPAGSLATGPGASALGTAAAAEPTAVSSAITVVGPPPACRVLSQKVWGKNANKTTGLTSNEMPDGRVAIGLALGNTPHVLVIGKGGNGQLMKVGFKGNASLAKAPAPGEGTRHIMRVTPVKIAGETAEAFIDFHDDFKDKRKRVACGPADSDVWIVYEDVPFFERDAKDREAGETRTALFKKHAEGDAYHELRDCRTFSDLRKNETWVVGSDLHVKEEGGSLVYKARLVIDKGSKVQEISIHDHKLKDEKEAKSQKYDIPVSHRIHDGGYLVGARFGASLVLGFLNQDKTARGVWQTYPGTPTIPDLINDGDDTVLVTSFARGKGEFTLKGLRLSGTKAELPKALSPIVLAPDDKDSETDPDFTRDSKGRRWLSYVDGERGHGKLFIAPIDANFHALGRPFEITQEKEKAASSKLVPLADGTLLAVFLREVEGGALEVVTEDLECDVVK